MRQRRWLLILLVPGLAWAATAELSDRSTPNAASAGEAAYAAANAAQAALAAGDWPTAIAAADHALATWPEHADLLVLRGLARFHRAAASEAGAALADLDAGLRRGTAYRARALLYAGLAASASQQPDRAETYLAAVLTEFPDSDEAKRLRTLVPDAQTTAPAAEPPPPDAGGWWSGYLALSALRDSDPAQSVASGNAPANADEGLASSAQLQFLPPAHRLGVQLRGSWTAYRMQALYDSATVGMAVVGDLSPAGDETMTLLLGAQREWTGQASGLARFGDSLWAEAAAHRSWSSSWAVEALAQARQTRFADPARGRSGSEGSFTARLSRSGAAWWHQQAGLSAGIEREVNRLGLGSWSAVVVRADWRLGDPRQLLLDFQAGWEERYAVEDTRPAPRLLTAGLGLWLPLADHLALTGFATGERAGGERDRASERRTVVGFGSTLWW